jgi:D-glycero-D-manno-heptose 1,7-bisphosphate phosphatase
MKTLFLDCDGTIREPASGAKFISCPDDQRIIEGAREAIEYYYQKGWNIIGITNQGGVAAGHKSLLEAITEQRITMGLLPQLKAIYMCPDFEGMFCYVIRDAASDTWETISRADFPTPGKPGEFLYPSFRKPGSGMLMMATDDYGCGHDSWYIGDREEDALCAAAAGINFMWADVWRSRFKKGLNEMDLSARHMNKEILLKFLAT